MCTHGNVNFFCSMDSNKTHRNQNEKKTFEVLIPNQAERLTKVIHIFNTSHVVFFIWFVGLNCVTMMMVVPMCLISPVNMWIIKILLLFFCLLFSFHLYFRFGPHKHTKFCGKKRAAKKRGKIKPNKTIHGTICLFGIIGLKWSLVSN